MPKADDLALYHSPTCPYCMLVTDALAFLDLQVELRNIRADSEFRAQLKEARGRTTVPVLRIREPGGDRWMPESRDIVAYLRERFG